MSNKTLIVIGAGPKAIAIATKNQVLRELGFSVPNIEIIEKRTVAANWTGDYGYTNGRLALGTSPEKDLGYPYKSVCFEPDDNEEINKRMARYSWMSFLVSEGKYSDWVDRGRPAPLHKEWAAYLQWASKLLGEFTHFHRGEVVKAAIHRGKWIVQFRNAGGKLMDIEGDGLVMTGPGQTRMERALPNHDNIFTVESFWRSFKRFQQETKPVRLAIVGSGENAASIAMALVESSNSQIQIDIICPSGMTFSRGESYRENRVYSDPLLGHWTELSTADRVGFMQRTDRGVFSIYAQKVLDRAPNIEVIAGLVRVVQAKEGKLITTLEYNGENREMEFDYMVLATGADQLSFLSKLIDRETEVEILKQTKLLSFHEVEVENKIDRSLAIDGLEPRLHLPMLSGLKQGPGFANLSSLGFLSDRILRPYLRKESA